MRGSWVRHLQSCLVGLVLLILVTGAIVLWKVNERGFSGEWGEQLQEQFDSRGFHAEFSSVRLSFSRGLVAKDLKIYADEDRSKLLASTDRLYVDVDRSSALRGQWELRSISFENAFVRLPDSSAPHNLTTLTGKATVNRDNRLTISETTGRLGQLDITLDAVLTDFTLDQSQEDKTEEEDGPDHFLTFLHTEVSKWSASQDHLPHLSLKVEGSIIRPQSLSAQFQFQAPQITRLEYQMSDLLLSGRINQSSLVFEQISFKDSAGSFSGNGYHDLYRRTAKFEATSDTDLERLLRLGLDIDKLQQLDFNQPPKITAKGQLKFQDGQKPELNLTGHLNVKDFRFLEGTWSSLASDFSWQKGNLYLRDLILVHPEGTLSGKLLFEDSNVRYQALSSLPAHLFDPFIKPEGNIRKTLDNAKFTSDTKVTLNVTGTIRPSDLTDWTASGDVVIENFSYNKVPANYGSSRFNLTPLQAVYTGPEIEFDLTNDRSFRRFGGPKSAVVRADFIGYDHTEKLTKIDHLYGVCWPAPVLRLFIPPTADLIERTYRFSEPLAFSTSGIADNNPSQERTSFHSRISSPAPLFYDFLGKEIELRETSALLHTRHRQIDVTELSTYAFSGPVDGKISVLLPNREGLPPDFRGEIKWTRLALSKIGETYDFEKIEKGLVTGRLNFNGTEKKIETLNGTGNFGLEKGELFKAPVFGPLSPLIAGIQGHERASHETARDASAQFIIRNGILYTDDFVTSTDSLMVKAEGSVDLIHKTIDMTARADTEGLLKLVTLPLNLTGLSGLFQFHGTGPLDDPTWKNMPFTRPKKEKKAPLFQPPPKARVVPE